MPDIATLTNDEGAFVVSAPSEGYYDIGIAADEFAPTSIMVNVKGGQELKLIIKLSALEGCCDQWLQQVILLPLMKN